MWKNYLKTAYRALARQKGYAFINVFGLAAGLSCVILIGLFVQHELSYDRFHEKADRLYRVIQERPTSTGPHYWSATSPALAPTLVETYPEVTAATTVGQTYNPLLSHGEARFQDEGVFAAENLFDLFTFPLLKGDPATALDDPGSIVLTETLARKIFGDDDPMGQTLLYQGEAAHTVTGVMADMPLTSHLQFEYVLPARANVFYRDGLGKPPWYNNGWFTYALLADGAAAAPVEAKLRAFVEENLADWQPENRMTFLLEPLPDVHLRSPVTGRQITYVYLFAAIGLVILLLACVNYTNLAVARSLRRRREVGVRKAVGAQRGQLLGQFLTESLVTTLLALAGALALVHLLLPVFGHLVERPLQIDYLGNLWLVPGLAALALGVALAAGGYPAFFMTALRPARALAGEADGRARRFSLQRVLIVGQFAAAVALVAGSLVVHEQMQHMQRQELGYDREHVLTVDADDKAISENYASIRERLLRDPSVAAVSYSKFLPTHVGNTQAMYGWEGSQEGELLSTSTTSVDHDFLDVYGINVVAGRGFSRAFGTDTLGAPVVLVSEATTRALGWTPKEAVGKRFGYTDDYDGAYTIIGVVEDFHFNSVRDALRPLVLTLGRNPTGYLSAKVRPENLQATIARFEEAVGQVSAYPFTYQFMDARFDALYKQEALLGQTFGFFTLLALLIAALGLVGLAAYAAERRTKEIGVRKALGASAASIVALLSKDFLKLVVVAFVLAAPVAYLGMQRWLEGFAYRVEVGPGLFLATGLAVLLVAVLAVSVQAVRAARTNPTEALRSE